MGICSETPDTLRWTVGNANSVDISFVWWVVGGSGSGGPVGVPANGTVNFTTSVEGSLPNTVAIMWINPGDGTAKSLSTNNDGTLCGGEAPTPTPTATPTSGVLIPVTGIDLPAIFRDSMFLNLGIGIFGFALIMLGIGIKVDRDRMSLEDEDGYEYYDDEDEE